MKQKRPLPAAIVVPEPMATSPSANEEAYEGERVDDAQGAGPTAFSKPKALAPVDSRGHRSVRSSFSSPDSAWPSPSPPSPMGSSQTLLLDDGHQTGPRLRINSSSQEQQGRAFAAPDNSASVWRDSPVPEPAPPVGSSGAPVNQDSCSSGSKPSTMKGLRSKTIRPNFERVLTARQLAFRHTSVDAYPYLFLGNDLPAWVGMSQPNRLALAWGLALLALHVAKAAGLLVFIIHVHASETVESTLAAAYLSLILIVIFTQCSYLQDLKGKDLIRLAFEMDPHRDGGGGPTAEVSTMLNQYLKTTIKRLSFAALSSFMSSLALVLLLEWRAVHGDAKNEECLRYITYTPLPQRPLAGLLMPFHIALLIAQLVVGLVYFAAPLLVVDLRFHGLMEDIEQRAVPLSEVLSRHQAICKAVEKVDSRDLLTALLHAYDTVGDAYGISFQRYCAVLLTSLVTVLVLAINALIFSSFSWAALLMLLNFVFGILFLLVRFCYLAVNCHLWGDRLVLAAVGALDPLELDGEKGVGGWTCAATNLIIHRLQCRTPCINYLGVVPITASTLNYVVSAVFSIFIFVYQIHRVNVTVKLAGRQSGAA